MLFFCGCGGEFESPIQLRSHQATTGHTKQQTSAVAASSSQKPTAASYPLSKQAEAQKARETSQGNHARLQEAEAQKVKTGEDKVAKAQAAGAKAAETKAAETKAADANAAEPNAAGAKAAGAKAAEAKACALCGSPEASKVCSACKKVRYCSRQHQQKHWKQHRVACTATPTKTQQLPLQHKPAQSCEPTWVTTVATELQQTINCSHRLAPQVIKEALLSVTAAGGMAELVCKARSLAPQVSSQM